jgi:two-component system response regulator FixJ
MSLTPTVFVVDDNAAVRTSLRMLFTASGLRVESYASGREFLAAYDATRSGCLVLDLRLRGESGQDVLDELARRRAPLPVVVLTAHGSVAASVRALRAGAVDFLEKPAPPAVLVEHVREALDTGRGRHEAYAERERIAQLFARLAPREKQVARLLVEGKTSKDIAAALGVSYRTIECYRSRVLQKMQVASATELVAELVRAGGGSGYVAARAARSAAERRPAAVPDGREAYDFPRAWSLVRARSYYRSLQWRR